MEEKIYELAVIGGGPGGIGSAVEAIALGLKNVVLFEKGEGLNTTIRKFYKDNKRVDKDYKGQQIELNGTIRFTDGTKETTLELFDELQKANNIHTRFKTEVESIAQNGEYFEIYANDGSKTIAKCIVISIGKMGQPNKPSYAIPSEIRAKVNFNANSVLDGEKLLIVGGGNSAVEYAVELCNTNPTTLNYRRSEFSRINETNAENLQNALKNGLKSKFGVDIVGIEADNDKVKVNFTDNSSETFDRVIYAIGGVSPIDFLKKCKIALDENGVPVVNENQESSRRGIFVAGDILFKNGGSIAAALNHGFQIAAKIAARLGAKK